MDPATAALIASGEGRGQFATVFKELARDYTDRELKKSQLRDALAYPAFLLFLAFAAIGVVTFVLVPAIAPIFEGTEQSPPLIVRTLGQLNSWFSGTIALALAPLFGLVLVFLLLPSVRSLARDALSATTTRLPIVGPLLTKVQLARYLSSLSMLLGSGTHMVQALTLAAECHATPAQRKTLLSVLERVASGEKLPTALGQCGLFDQRIVSLIAVGDEVGRLPAVTARSAAILESEATRGINRLVATITPALTIVLGLLVGTLVVSVMTALLSVNEFALR
jgi:general secretion pathway protein F